MYPLPAVVAGPAAPYALITGGSSGIGREIANEVQYAPLISVDTTAVVRRRTISCLFSINTTAVLNSMRVDEGRNSWNLPAIK